MKVERPEVVRSPDNPQRVRLAAAVSYRDGTAEDYWFEVDRELEDVLTPLGNPWLVSLLPLAMVLGEPLELPSPVDPLLYESAQHLMHIWKEWHPRLHLVPVEAPAYRGPLLTGDRKVAAFFSGGVDSFFTALRHRRDAPGCGLYLDDLLFVEGADIAVGNRAAFSRVQASLSEAAGRLGMRLVTIGTNLRDTRWGTRTNWTMLSHGAAMAATVLALEPRYRITLIASSMGYRSLKPWGSHPLTDPMLSTTELRIVYDGAFLSRMLKLRELVQSDIAMRHLRVCWRSSSGDNCCACEKCYRTMAALAAYDALERCATFRTEEFRLDRLARLFLPSRMMNGVRELESLARSLHKPELARALRRSLRHSQFLNVTLPVIRRFKCRRGVSGLAGHLESRLLAGVFS